jgi:hypothetical protein
VLTWCEKARQFVFVNARNGSCSRARARKLVKLKKFLPQARY